MARSLARVLIPVLLVLIAYVFYGSAGTFRYALTASWEESYYASLAEGFVHGKLSMAHTADPQLAVLPNPYSPAERGNIRWVWDASYFAGRYYLYFSPLPVLLLYLPMHAVSGLYPSDDLAATVFAAIALLISVALLRRAVGTNTRVPFWLWTLFLGLGNFVPYGLVQPRMYHTAILMGTVFSAGWAYAVLRYLQSGSRSAALMMGCSFALAAASRPNLLVLAPVAIGAVFLRPRQRFTFATFLGPLLVIAIAVGAYNFARFGSMIEFGHGYQLTAVDMTKQRVCGIRCAAEAARLVNNLMHYFFPPPVVASSFPYVKLPDNNLDPKTSFPAREPMGGLVPIMPITAWAIVLALTSARGALKRRDDSSLTAAVLMIIGALLVIIGLSTCWFVTARYSLDFAGLLSVGSALIVERWLASQEDHARSFKLVASILVSYSIVLGLLIGLMRLPS